MGLLGGFIGLISLVLAGLALICLAVPIKSLGMGTRKRAGSGLLIAVGLFVVSAVFANMAGAPPSKPAETPKAAATNTAPAEGEQPLGDTPAGKPIPSYDDQVAGFCLTGEAQPYCEASLASFKGKDWPGAWRGDYQGQRNVSFCLSSGCDGAVKENPVGGCAWRIIIMASGSPKVDDTDTQNHKLYCGRLTNVERAAAHAQAERTFAAIYGRNLPKGF